MTACLDLIRNVDEKTPASAGTAVSLEQCESVQT